MGDRLAASNGKRYRAWGTRELCPECGGCLCYGCHPEGPCVEDEKQAAGGWQLAAVPYGDARYAEARQRLGAR